MKFAFLLALTLGLTPAGALAAAPASADSAALDKLYARLAKTPYSDEAVGILAEIDQLRTQSGSDTADLLLARAQKARAAANLPLALQLFDAVVDLDPEWSEAWSERASARYQSGDVGGAMGDLAQTLKREPRDVGALAGLGAILLDSGYPEAALKVYDRALKLAPAYEPLQEAHARAQTMVWSRSP